MKIIDRYISRAIFAATAVVTLVVAALVVLTVFIGEIEDIGDGRYGIVKGLVFMLLRLPDHLYIVFPVVALLGALLALGALAAGSELIVIRAAGVSMRRLGVSVGLAGGVLALLTLAMGEYLAPAGIRAGDTLKDRARHGEQAQSIDNGLWLRQGNTILRIDATLPDGGIQDLAVYRLSNDGRLEQAITAPRATLRDGRLVLDHPRYTRLMRDATQTGSPSALALDMDIDPKVLALAVTQPGELSSPGLWRYINYLDRNDIDARNYRLALWRNIVNPFTVWVLVVFALPFAFGSLRSAGAGQRLFLGGMIGLVFFLANEIVASSGAVYGLPPWLAASLPTVLLAVATAMWMRRLS